MFFKSYGILYGAVYIFWQELTGQERKREKGHPHLTPSADAGRPSCLERVGVTVLDCTITSGRCITWEMGGGGGGPVQNDPVDGICTNHEK